MSIMNPLPPQAYTKDTLVQAYAWLQGQSDNIKELATTPDVLVSLYLRAKLQGNSALERPSIQNFKNELKNLAGMMGEFEVVEQQGAATGPSTELASSTIRFRSQNMRASLQAPPAGAPASSQQSQAQESAAAAKTTENSEFHRLDSRSLDMIQDVKIQFNLSSDTEAMRLLISIGYNQVKSLLK